MRKTCFVICAIGSEGSDCRKRADKVLKHVVRPAAEGCGYAVVRSDEEGQPNQITTDVIMHLRNDDIVVVDLTYGNPNVYYELGVRHCFRMPAVQIIDKGEDLPFDLGSQRTIPLDLTDPDSVEECKKDLAEQIAYAVANAEKITTPVSVAVAVEVALATGDPTAAVNQAIMGKLEEIEGALRSLVRGGTRAGGRLERRVSAFAAPCIACGGWIWQETYEGAGIYRNRCAKCGMEVLSEGPEPPELQSPPDAEGEDAR